MKTTSRSSLARGPETSEEFNQIVNDIADDLQELSVGVNLVSAERIDIVDILSRENMFLYNQLMALYSDVIDLQSAVDQIRGDSPTRTMHKTFANQDGISLIKNAMIDTYNRIATINTTAEPISRTHLYDDEIDELYVPIGLSLTVNESLTSDFSQKTVITSKTDPTLLNVINEDSCSYWTREIENPDQSEALYIKVNIKLPAEFINSPSCNTLIINPYPSYSMSLYKIECKNTLGQTVVLYNEEVAAIPRMNIRFNTVDIQDITVYLKQRPIYESGSWKFVYGFQKLDIQYNEVLHSQGSFATMFSLPEGHFFNNINEPVTELAPFTPQGVESLVTYKLFSDPGLKTEMSFGETLADISEVYVQTTIKRSTTSNTVPVLSGFKFTYVVRDF